jgi:SAM-dependent methyltransferase
MSSPALYLLALALAEGDLRVVRDYVRRSFRAERRTLEIGCGPGLFADLFASGDYVGVDPRPRFVDYGRHHRPGSFIGDELASVGLPNARFDQALAFDVFGSRSDAAGKAILAEIKRLLAPAGRALVVERAKSGGRVERLASAVGRIERRHRLRSGGRDRLAFVLST